MKAFIRRASSSPSSPVPLCSCLRIWWNERFQIDHWRRVEGVYAIDDEYALLDCKNLAYGQGDQVWPHGSAAREDSSKWILLVAPWVNLQNTSPFRCVILVEPVEDVDVRPLAKA